MFLKYLLTNIFYLLNLRFFFQSFICISQRTPPYFIKKIKIYIIKYIHKLLKENFILLV